MKAIGIRGSELLALVEDDADLEDPRLQVMLENTRTGEKTGPLLWQSVLARGYWEPVDENYGKSQ